MNDENHWEGWHFLPSDRQLRYNDGREVKAGETLSCKGPLSLCSKGMHASRRAIDALKYAPGPIVCRVRLSGDLLAPDGEDKACATERTVLAMADATRVLHEWSAWCAERVLALFEKEHPNDNRLRLALEAKRKWLSGEIADDDLAAAQAAALDASLAASLAAAQAAAWAAAQAAALDAALDASLAAAQAAALAAAQAAAQAAARAAAWEASWDAARDEQSAELEKRLANLLGIEVQ